MVKKCMECGTEIPEKYIYCQDCAKKNKEKQDSRQADFSAQHNELIKAISQVNQNLYALRTIAEFFLEKKHNSKLIWIKRTGAGTEKEKKGYFEIKD